MSKITEVILETIVKYKKINYSPSAINEGLCGQFATAVIDKMKLISDEKCIPLVSVHDEITHCWIYCNGKHYDSEVPTGVDAWTDLPLVKRNLNKND